MESENPLVSIIVVTYNSSEYVLETLESAKAQTYHNIELIVSDDCSTDNTVEICRNWMNDNKERFVRTQLITVIKNTGIPANVNRGIYAANGELIKSIAGDDTIDASFISRCVPEFNNSKVAFCFTKSKLINSKSDFIREDDCSKFKDGNIFEDIFFIRFWPKGPSYMYRKKCIIDVGSYNEDIWVEDYLMIMKLSFYYEARYINEFLANYRKHNSNSGNTSIKLYESQIQSIRFFRDYSGYSNRRRQIELKMLLHIAKYNKIVFPLKLWFCLKYFYDPLLYKCILYYILYWKLCKMT